MLGFGMKWFRIQSPRYETTCGAFPKLGVPILVVPRQMIRVFWGLYWGPSILGSCHVYFSEGPSQVLVNGLWMMIGPSVLAEARQVAKGLHASPGRKRERKRAVWKSPLYRGYMYGLEGGESRI